METTHFAENLKTLRIEKGLSQTELAKLLGVDQRTISNWENKICEPSFETLGKLCDIFDESLENILT